MTPSHNDAEEDPEQWTRIVRKGKGNKLGRRTLPADPPAAGPVENFQPNARPQLSAQEIHADYDEISSRWLGSACHDILSELVRDNAPSHAAVRRAVCLGLGAFDPEDGSLLAQRRTHIQLAAFLTIVQILEEEGKRKIECFYQEPRFAQPDKDFIASLGGKVLDSPASYDLIDETTLVYGIHLYRDVWNAALDKGLPAMCVGTGWDVWEGCWTAERCSDLFRVKEMEDGTAFDKYPFPMDFDMSFSNTCIYWKAEDAEDTEDLPQVSPADDEKEETEETSESIEETSPPDLKKVMPTAG